MKLMCRLAVLWPVFGLAVCVVGGEWPMFRGPNASGLAENSRPPLRIGTNENVLWRVDVPFSASSLSVWGGRLYLVTVAENRLETRAYDCADGKRVWTQVAPAKELEDYHLTDGSPAAATPATDGEVVVSYFGSAGLFCYSVSGEERWRHALPRAQTYGGFGSGTSPLLLGDRVILVRDVLDGPTILALDRKTGKKVWETARPGCLTGYGTPVVWEHDGVRELVVAGGLALKSYDVASGVERWAIRGLPAVTCTTAVVGDGHLYFAGWSPGKSDAPFPTWESRLEEWDKNGDRALSLEEFAWGPATFRSIDSNKNSKLEASEWQGLLELVKKGENVLLAVKPGGTGDVTSTHVAWKATRGLPYVASPLHYRGRVYLVKDGGLLSCFDAITGEAVIQQERIADAAGSYYASPVAADGRIYFASLQGKVTLVRAGTDKVEIMHQADFGDRIFATPALVGNRLYLRTASKLYAFGS